MYFLTTVAVVLALVVAVTADCSSTCNAQCRVITAVCQNNLATQCYNISCTPLTAACKKTCKSTMCSCTANLYSVCSAVNSACLAVVKNTRFCSQLLESCITTVNVHCYSDYASGLATGFIIAASNRFTLN